MKYLEINNGRVKFSYIGTEGTIQGNLENITQEDIKVILTQAYKDAEFKFDELSEGEKLVNPIEKIIYQHLSKQLMTILSNRDNAKNEEKTYFSKAMEKYSSNLGKI